MESLGRGESRRHGSYSFLTSELDGGEWSAFYPQGKDPGTHWIGGLVVVVVVYLTTLFQQLRLYSVDV
jgi:hypothetical protein